MRHIESQIQKNCVAWFRLQYPSIGRLLFAVPNGGARNAREAGIMKGEGVTAGVSDLILVHTTDSEAWDYINDDSNKEKHMEALRHCYMKIKQAYENR